MNIEEKDYVEDSKDLLRACLDDLEARIDPLQETELLAAWSAFAHGRFSGQVFSPKRDTASPPQVEWPKIRVNRALEDFDLMALQQYGSCSAMLESGCGHVMCVRSNYGSSIVPLLFGVEPFVMADEFNTLPTSRPLNDVDAVKRLLDAGVPDLSTGYGAQVLEMGRRYDEIAQQYPNIDRYVYIYHPDTQGPMDICEVVWGSTIFYALYDQPDLVKEMLELVTETYIQFMRAWLEVRPFYAGGNAHWGLFHKGNIMIRDDSAMNLSVGMFDQFIRPYDQRLLDEFGGGAVHFCGKGDHYMPSMTEMEGLYAINMSQPEYNDMESIYRNTVDKGVQIVGLRPETAQQALDDGRDVRGRVQTFVT